METFFLKTMPRILTVVLLAAMIWREYRSGYLRVPFSLSGLPKIRMLLFLAVWTGGLTLLLFFDRPWLAWVRGHEGAWAEGLLALGRAIGQNRQFWLGVGVIYWLASFVFKKHGREIAASAVFASAVTGLLTHILKYAILRTRPTETESPYHFFRYHEFANANLHLSFPSGDVALVAAFSSYLFLSLRHPLRWLLLLLPLATAFARMMANRHWPSDTFFAAAMAFAVAFFVHKWREAKIKS